MMQIPFLLILLCALAFAQNTIDVDVGEDGLIYKPSTVTAAPGSTVNFHFYSGDHSVAQSTYDSPCVPSGPDAIWSGFINPSNTKVASMMFTITINNTKPIWIYCAQGDHCESGMAMVINPP
jgi:plastocyanin